MAQFKKDRRYEGRVTGSLQEAIHDLSKLVMRGKTDRGADFGRVLVPFRGPAKDIEYPRAPKAILELLDDAEFNLEEGRFYSAMLLFEVAEYLMEKFDLKVIFCFDHLENNRIWKVSPIDGKKPEKRERWGWEVLPYTPENLSRTRAVMEQAYCDLALLLARLSKEDPGRIRSVESLARVAQGSVSLAQEWGNIGDRALEHMHLSEALEKTVQLLNLIESFLNKEVPEKVEPEPNPYAELEALFVKHWAALPDSDRALAEEMVATQVGFCHA